ncbi:hypothetical protein DIPPA_20759 [Diplonema papillatum]|nr:hypothetical protein DIPPA_20759 [Diplonema papillatum]
MGVVVRPRNRTRLTVWQYGSKTKKDIEVCKPWLSLEEWERWVEGTTIVHGVLVRNKEAAKPRLAAVESESVDNTSDVNSNSSAEGMQALSKRRRVGP